MKRRHDLTLENLALRRLKQIQHERRPGCIIPFPDAYARVCPLFTLDKKTARDVFRNMHRKGMISIVRNHGIRLR